VKHERQPTKGEKKMSIEFKKTTQEMTLLAAYVAGLVREGVTFKLAADDCAVRVTLTGGF
jgi:hypothetical protein